MECQWGAGGALYWLYEQIALIDPTYADVYDCGWSRYTLDYPLYELDLIKVIALSGLIPELDALVIEDYGEWLKYQCFDLTTA